METSPTEKGSPRNKKAELYARITPLGSKTMHPNQQNIRKAGKRTAWMNKEQSDIRMKKMGDEKRVRPLHDSKELVRLSRKNSRPSRIKSGYRCPEEQDGVLKCTNYKSKTKDYVGPLANGEGSGLAEDAERQIYRIPALHWPSLARLSFN